MFNQKFNYQKLERESIEGRRHYCLPDGSRVPSVTTILDSTKTDEKRRALNQWRQRVGPQMAQEITTEAASRGTRMHKWLENYVRTGELGMPGSNPFSRQSHSMANIIIFEGLASNVSEFWGVEVPIYYTGLYAGTTDCVGVWKGKPAIMDFKQTNKPKKQEWIDDYFLQLAAYSLAHNNIYNTDIKTGVILMCSANEPHIYQEFVIEDYDFEKWCDRWWDRVEQYYLQNK